jgi:hypothetical protein
MQDATKASEAGDNMLESVKRLLCHLCFIGLQHVPASTVILNEITAEVNGIPRDYMYGYIIV